VLFECAHPRRLGGFPVEFVGDDQTYRIGRRRVTISIRTAAPLSGLPLGMRNSTGAVRRTRTATAWLPQAIPCKRALDDKHAAIRVPGAASCGPYGVGGLADQQRFVARHQVSAGDTAPESLS